MDVFEAEPKSIIELFSGKGGGVGYYIPAYQREYSWDSKNHVNRFLDDICIGIKNFLEYEDSITFIGSIISIKDTENKTIKPFITGQLPESVMALIDGQQRITTMAIFSTVLHNLLCIKLAKLDKVNEVIKNWLLNKSGRFIKDLTDMYQLDTCGTDEKFKLYPKIIRAYNDQWSRDKVTAEYKSPIAKYLFAYIDFVRTQQNNKPIKLFSYHVSDKEKKQYNHNKVIENIKFLQKKVKDVITNKYEDLKCIPLLQEISDQETLEKRFFSEGIPNEIKSELGKENLITEILSLLIIIKFFLNKVAVTSVVAKNESYAFDMFEALNTTGEPLTALETFKPKVIEAEKIEEYERSVSKKYIDFIDSIFNKCTQAEAKQKETTKLLIPFRLLFEGEKLSKHLSAQRRFLNRSYDGCKDIAAKQNFVKIMCDLAEFMEKIWPNKSNNNLDFNEYNLKDKDLIMLCLKVLSEANHTITISLIVRYYSYAKSQDYSQESLFELSKAIKAIIAFFVIWRASRSSTGGIDECYRDLMKNGYSYKNDENIRIKVVDKFSIKDASIKPPLASDLQKAFRCIISNAKQETNKFSINNKKEWNKKVIIQPIAEINKPLTRFILLISSHDTTILKNTSYGTVTASTEGFNNMLDVARWDEYSTIEHIWPKNPKEDGWSSDLKELDNCDVIGNLTLLPKSENSSLGYRNWEDKKSIYQILSAETEDKREEYMKLAKDKGINISNATNELISQARHLPQLKAISKIDDFNKKCVEERGKCFASITWDRISSWLDYPKESE